METPKLKRETVRGTAYDVKRFNGAVNAIMATDLITNEEVKQLEEIKERVKLKYLEQ